MSELRQRKPVSAAAAGAPAATDRHAVASAASTSTASAVVSVGAFTAACLLLLLPIRILAALYMPIQDCDETFNYWEPLHFLMFGRGLQTWEYSPQYGLRSYAYLWLISPIGWAIKWGHELLQSMRADGSSSASAPQQEVDKLVLFYAMRLSFAVACAFVETRLLRTVRRLLGAGVAQWTLLFLALSAGMCHASQAFLPQTFTMIFVMLTLNAWMNRDYRMSIFYTGVCSLVGWPFSVLLSVPLALEVLWVYRGRALVQPIRWGATSAALCVLPCLIVDFAYYRRIIFAVVNIAVYNSNSTIEHGANLFGREPASFYFMNLALNFNVAAALALIAPLMLAVAWISGVKLGTSKTSPLSVLRWLLPFYLWFGIFLSMPHKEERFLFVVYPYICLCAGVSAALMHGMLGGHFVPLAAARAALGKVLTRTLSILFVAAVAGAFVTLSGSRVASLLVNYRAPLQVWTAVHDQAQQSVLNPDMLPFPLSISADPTVATPGAIAATTAGSSATELVAQAPESVNVCVGKEWYRFPAHFFLPTLHLPSSSSSSSSSSPAAASGSTRTLEFTLRFLESDFGGLLPKAYLREWEWEVELTKRIQERDQSAKENPAAAAPSPLVESLLRAANLSLADGASIRAGRAPPSLLSSLFPHLTTRPGTHRLPTHMNDLNRREDGGRFVPPERCHFIVDFALPLQAQREPRYEKHQVTLAQPMTIAGRCVAGWRWRVEFEAPFLDAAASPDARLRAFFVPTYSSRSNVMRPYQMLKRMPIEC